MANVCLLWALNPGGGLVHRAAALTAAEGGNGLYACPCCRRPVHVDVDQDGFVHQHQDCGLGSRTAWSTNTMPFGTRTKDRRKFLRHLLLARWRGLHIACALCSQTSPVLPPGEVVDGLWWRDLLLDIAVVRGTTLLGALVLADSSTAARTVSQRIDGMLDMSNYRIFVVAVDEKMDITPLLTNKSQSLVALQLGSFDVQAGECEIPGACCGVCHLVHHTEPHARRRLLDHAFRDFTTRHLSPIMTMATTTPQQPSPRPPPAQRKNNNNNNNNNNSTTIRNTVFGDVPVVIHGSRWRGLTTEQRCKAVELWWTGMPSVDDPSVLGLWCLKCSPCTSSCQQSLSTRVAKHQPWERAAACDEALHEFDTDTARYGPKAGITRRQRMQRYLRIHNVAPALHSRVCTMILECDTVGTHRYTH